MKTVVKMTFMKKKYMKIIKHLKLQFKNRASEEGIKNGICIVFFKKSVFKVYVCVHK